VSRSAQKGCRGKKGPGQRGGGHNSGNVEVLAETITKNDSASPRRQAGLRDDIRKDGRSIAVT
jgi:hypothetical protein